MRGCPNPFGLIINGLLLISNTYSFIKRYPSSWHSSASSLQLTIQMQKGKKEGESNILVAIRIRPLNQKEGNSGEWDIIRVQDNLMIILDPIEMEFEAQNKKMLEVLHRSKEQRYAFDKLYREHTSEQIYSQTVRPLIKTVLNGLNATVFAYGPTGTGKTYTMLGNQEKYGLNVLAIRDIFDEIQRDDQYDYTVVITYVEIYNQMIRDLLLPSPSYLELRDDPEKGIIMSGVTEFKAESTDQVMNLLLLGNKRRTTEATNANQTSSRSHAVFQINVSKVSKTKNTNVETLIGKLSLIDLAGSERGTVTENRGIRLVEGAKINRSLLALANCINALGDKNKKGFFVPYRDSKLTRLLKDSLGGNCKTVMIANVSPASSQFEQTINTLKYANRAKNIKTKLMTNKKLVSLHISEYKNIINDLRQEIEQLKLRLNQKGNQGDGPGEEAEIKKSNVIQNKGTECTCGRGEEVDEMRKIQEQIFQNFNQRIQLRRALMEIQEQNALNILEIKRKQGEILIFKKSQATQDSEQGKKVIQEIRSISEAIQTLKMSTNKNIITKQIRNLQLMQSMASTKKIRDDIGKKIKFKSNRDFLEMVIKNHVFELQNIELQINLQIQQKIITDLKNIIVAQKRTITDHGIQTLKLDDQIIDNDQVDLEIDEDPDEQVFPLDDEDDDQEYKENKEKLRMNQHFQNKKRDKSISKNVPNTDPKNVEKYQKLKSFEKSSDDQEEKQSDRKKQKRNVQQQQPISIKDMGIVGQTALKQPIVKKEQQQAKPSQKDQRQQREKTVEKGNGILQLNLKGKNILLPNINKKKKV